VNLLGDESAHMNPKNYQIGNLIGALIHHVTSAWGILVSQIPAVSNSVGDFLTPFLWFDIDKGIFVHLREEDGYSPLAQRQGFTPPSYPEVEGPAIDASIAALPENHLKWRRYLSYVFLKKPKD